MNNEIENLEWRWVDDKGRAMTQWKRGNPPPALGLKDDKGGMHVEVRVTPPAAPKPEVVMEVGIRDLPSRLRDACCGPDGGDWVLLREAAAELERAVRLEAALRDAPGGHRCEEFHHSKVDRHLPGEPCPPMERWHASRAALTGDKP